MMLHETLYFRKRPFGRIIMDTNTGNVHFAPHDLDDPDFKKIAHRTWRDPIRLREKLIALMESRHG